MVFKDYLQTLTLKERDAFAERVGSTAAHLRNISYGYRPCGESLAIEIERESGRLVSCEELRPDVDWAFLRNSVPPNTALRKSSV